MEGLVADTQGKTRQRPRLLGLRAAAEYIGLAESSLRRIVSAGQIPCVRTTLTSELERRKVGRIYLRPEDLDAWVDLNLTPRRPRAETPGLAAMCELPMPAIRRFG